MLTAPQPDSDPFSIPIPCMSYIMKSFRVIFHSHVMVSMIVRQPKLCSRRDLSLALQPNVRRQATILSQQLSHLGQTDVPELACRSAVDLGANGVDGEQKAAKALGSGETYKS